VSHARSWQRAGLSAEASFYNPMLADTISDLESILGNSTLS
jgi:hypothetical protein